MKVAVSGASGLIGSALVPALAKDGHEVVRLVRRPASSPSEISWDPAKKQLDPASLNGVDAVIHLAGAGVGDHRWTDEYKAEIMDSRVLGTETISRAIAEADTGPRVLVSGSAIGYYGDRGAEVLTEQSSPGTGFLAEVVVAWEAATHAAEAAGARVTHARTGLVMSKSGGAWGRLLPIMRLGVGGNLGSGQQYWSFISLRDEVRALIHCMDSSSLTGAVNLVAPHAVTNAEATRVLAKAIGRPAFLPVPKFALRAAVGEFASDILGSQNVVPDKLTESGFTWEDPTIEKATATLLAS